MTLIRIDDRGLATVEIEAPDGELVSYRADASEDGASVELHNLLNGEHYTVLLQSPKLWRCDCPAWKFRRSKHADRGCKHCVACQRLVAVLTNYQSLLAPNLEKRPMTTTVKLPADIEAALTAPFDPRQVKFRAGAVSGGRALALAYIDARTVQDRLDAVLGITGWQVEYEALPSGCIFCKLRLKIDGEWITKSDVGGQSEQADEGDRTKAAVSDALKRAAVTFGIGRYLYRLPAEWVEYDPQKKQLKKLPALPAWALPAKAAAQTQVAAKTPASSTRGPDDAPTDGIELEQRLGVWDQRAAAGGYCQAGGIIAHITDYGRREGGIQTPMANWPRVVVQAAWAELKRYAQELMAQKKTA